VADTFPLLWNCLSIIPYIIVWLMTGNSSESVRNAGDIIGDVMTVIPTLAYQRGTQRLLSLQFAVDRASRVENSPVEWSDTFNPANGVLTPLLVNLAVMSLSSSVPVHNPPGFMLMSLSNGVGVVPDSRQDFPQDEKI
ncbi:hypothetical protein FOZ63_021076, partial [Perkinsus olseni]